MESNRRIRDPCDPGSVSDLIAFLPDNAERVVTSTSSTASSPLDRIGWCTHEVIAPWPHMPNLYSRCEAIVGPLTPLFKGSFRSSRLSRSSRLWDFQIRLWDFQMILKWSRIAEYETLVILVQCLISLLWNFQLILRWSLMAEYESFVILVQCLIS